MASLTKQVVKGGFWITFLKVVTKGLSVIRTIILANLLDPKHFGIMGVVLLSIAFLYRFSQTGVGLVLVHKKDDVEEYMGTTFILNVARGAVIFCMLFFGSGLLAKFFDNPGITIYLQVAAFSPLILAFLSPRTVYLDKKLQFQNRFILEASATFCDIAVSITCALIFRNAWALILGLLAGDITRAIVSYFLYPWKIRPSFDSKQALELFHFGKWIFINGILMFAISQGADVIAGKVLGLTALGLYQMAYRLTNMVASEVYQIFNQVTFPAYAKLQDDTPRLRNAFLRVVQLVSIVSLPVTIVIIAFSPDFTRLFFGDNWLAMIPAMQILANISLFSALGAAIGPLFLSVGRPDIPTKLQFVNLGLLVIFLYPLTVKFNITGTAMAIFITYVALVPIRVGIVLKILKCRVMEFLRQFRVAVSCALPMVLVICLSKNYVFRSTDYVSFFAGLILALMSYVCALFVLDGYFQIGFRPLLKISRISRFLFSWKEGHE